MTDVHADDDTTLARTFLQHVANDLYAFSSPAFQRSIWIRGDPSRRYVHDFIEAVETFQEFAGWLIDDKMWKNVPLSAEQAAALERFQETLLAFSDSLPNRDSAVAIADPRWPAIVSAAKDTLNVLEAGGHGIVPQVTDDDL